MSVKIQIIISFILFFSTTLVAQKFETDVCFEGVFDNREYFSPYNSHKTILGGRTSVAFGSSFDSTHIFRFGLSEFYDFGDTKREFRFDLLMYYAYQNKGFKMYFGAFPTHGLLETPRALLKDEHHYYHSIVEGLFVQYSTAKWKQLIYIDWLSSQDSITKETILFAGEGKVNFGRFSIEDYWQILHRGLTTTHSGAIQDYVGIMALLAYDMKDFLPLNKAKIKGGVLHSLWRDRAYYDDFQLNFSAYAELIAEKKHYGLKSSLHVGQKHKFFLGDQFYNNASTYNRTDLFIRPIYTSNVEVKFTWSFHLANGILDNQQMLNILYKI